MQLSRSGSSEEAPGQVYKSGGHHQGRLSASLLQQQLKLGTINEKQVRDSEGFTQSSLCLGSQVPFEFDRGPASWPRGQYGGAEHTQVSLETWTWPTLELTFPLFQHHHQAL